MSNAHFGYKIVYQDSILSMISLSNCDDMLSSKFEFHTLTFYTMFLAKKLLWQPFKNCDIVTHTGILSLKVLEVHNKSLSLHVFQPRLCGGFFLVFQCPFCYTEGNLEFTQVKAKHDAFLEI